MTIKVGDKLPDVTFVMPGGDGPSKVTTADYFGGKKVVLFAVPGAFTPTCHGNHLPGFLKNIDQLKTKGADKIACTAVNDVHVMKAWANASNATGKIDFLADGSADFAKAVGLDLDGSGFGMGTRSKRYAMIVENGVVTALNVEDVPSKAEASSADAMLALL